MPTLNDEIARLRELDARRTFNTMSVTESGDVLYQHGTVGRGMAIPDAQFIAAAPTMMAVIEQQARMLAAAREALEYIRHRDSRWHDDDVATPAITFISPDRELDPGPVETVVRLDEETEVVA